MTVIEFGIEKIDHNKIIATVGKNHFSKKHFNTLFDKKHFTVKGIYKRIHIYYFIRLILFIFLFTKIRI